MIALCIGGIKLTCTKKMHGHLPNQCTLLKGMYVILNGCCTYPLHLILRQQPEKLWGKKNMNYTYNVDAYSFSGALDFVNKLSHSMQIMKVKFVLSGGSQSWPFFYEWCCNFGLKLPHKTVIARLNNCSASFISRCKVFLSTRATARLAK